MKSDRSLRVCSRCVMDASAKEIVFDEQGYCHFCNSYLRRNKDFLNRTPAEWDEKLKSFAAEIKKAGKGKAYDCVVGVSGGVDSSWVLVKVVELGLRPLAVHMDNGWNSELSQNNIANLVNELHVDLYTHVIDWEEYRAFLQAFLDADVLDVELLMDNAMLAVNYQMAAKYGVRHILAGTNTATEGIPMPRNWNWYKYDKKNIVSIAKRFTGARPKTFPLIGTWDYMWYEKVRGIRWISFLDVLDYQKDRAVEVLKDKYGYKPYPYKHYESVLTRFYQGHILVEKFGIDKRKLHLSTLIASGQMERSEAMGLLKSSPYASELALKEDREYFIKKMKWTDAQFEDYMTRPMVGHDEYPSERPFWDQVFKLYNRLKDRS